MPGARVESSPNKEDNSMNIKIIGLARTSYLDPAECPRQGRGDMPACTIELDPVYAPGLHRLRQGQEVIVLTWMHLARRDIYLLRPGNDPARPLHGVFCTRSPHRPNPIGLHQVRILEIHDCRLVVHPLEVVDKTPVVDIKPVLQEAYLETGAEKYFSSAEIQSLVLAGKRGWERGLFSGINGNLSLMRQGLVLITRSGCFKGALGTEDLSVMDLESGRTIAGEQPSIESGMHLEIYKGQEKARAVAHTHPVSLLALSRAGDGTLFQGQDLFEARAALRGLGRVEALEPGSKDLARAVGEVARKYACIFMDRHGLTCLADDIAGAMNKSEELESLAGLEIKTRMLER